MKLIKRGAEAVLYKTKHWKQDALLKKRIPKKYRTAILDEKIRKQRTKQEAILLHHAKKATVRTPTLLKVDKKKHQLWMEWIPGKALKTVLGKQHANWCKAIGKKIALLHTAGIIHGDLTTSNIIVSGKELVFVDFGLGFFSNKIEDRAVDLVNFKKTFEATHTRFPHGFQYILKGYQEKNPKSELVFRQMEKIEQRIRYS